MKTKLILTLAVATLLFAGCKSEDKEPISPVKTIKINTDTALPNHDISEMLDTSFYRVVALETKKECLVGAEIKGLYYRNGRIYVWEEQTKGVFMFDENGKFLAKIQNVGEGPDDYINIDQVQITGDKIYIYDYPGHKMLIYDTDCHFLERIFTKDVYDKYFNINKAFVVGDRMYFADALLDEQEPKNGELHQMCSMDLKGSDIKMHLPYKKEDAVSHLFYLNEQYYKDVDGKVRFMTSKLDTVYVATKDTIYPEYVFDLGEKQLPKSLHKATFSQLRGNEDYKKYFSGVSRFYDTGKYLIFQFLDKNNMAQTPNIPEEVRKDPEKMKKYIKENVKSNDYILFLNKETGEVEKFINGMYMEYFGKGRIALPNIDGQYMISPMVIYSFFFKDGKIPPVSIPSNKGYEKVVNQAYSKVDPQSNPIIYIYKMKE